MRDLVLTTADGRRAVITPHIVEAFDPFTGAERKGTFTWSVTIDGERSNPNVRSKLTKEGDRAFVKWRDSRGEG